MTDQERIAELEAERAKLLAWLAERIDWYTNACLKSAEERGYPGKIRFADERTRDVLEAYQDVLEFAGSASISTQKGA